MRDKKKCGFRVALRTPAATRDCAHRSQPASRRCTHNNIVRRHRWHTERCTRRTRACRPCSSNVASRAFVAVFTSRVVPRRAEKGEKGQRKYKIINVNVNTNNNPPARPLALTGHPSAVHTSANNNTLDGRHDQQRRSLCCRTSFARHTRLLRSRVSRRTACPGRRRRCSVTSSLCCSTSLRDVVFIGNGTLHRSTWTLVAHHFRRSTTLLMVQNGRRKKHYFFEKDNKKF